MTCKTYAIAPRFVSIFLVSLLLGSVVGSWQLAAVYISLLLWFVEGMQAGWGFAGYGYYMAIVWFFVGWYVKEFLCEETNE